MVNTVNQLFLWPFSIANCNKLPEAGQVDPQNDRGLTNGTVTNHQEHQDLDCFRFVSLVNQLSICGETVFCCKVKWDPHKLEVPTYLYHECFLMLMG